MDSLFDHERLEVYRVAREFNRGLNLLLRDLPRGHSDSKDNLKRGAKSITRNVAEGAGKWQIPDKVNFYHIARGSATECAASLDELVDFGLVRKEQIVDLRQLLSRIVAMLTSMIRSLEERDRPRSGA